VPIHFRVPASFVELFTDTLKLAAESVYGTHTEPVDDEERTVFKCVEAVIVHYRNCSERGTDA
jgi:hypothetical protein